MERATLSAGSITVTLEKPGGMQRAGVKANFDSGQPNQILIHDVSFPLEKGDLIKRTTPAGIENIFEVLEPGFADPPGLQQHYRAKVKPVQSKGELGERGETDSRKVFVVHGRNEKARTAMVAFLRAIDLRPIEWSEAVDLTGEAAPFIGQVVEAGFSAAQAVVIMLTGDDLAKLRPEFVSQSDAGYEKEYTLQARPNVLFEAGFAFGRHPKRTVIVEFGQLRPFSDVQGRHVIRMDNSVKKRQELAKLLGAAGCAVSTSGVDWHTAGDFDVI